MCESSLSVVLPEGEDDGAAELPVRVPQKPLQFLLDGETHQVLPRQDTLHLSNGDIRVLNIDALDALRYINQHKSSALLTTYSFQHLGLSIKEFYSFSQVSHPQWIK